MKFSEFIIASILFLLTVGFCPMSVWAGPDDMERRLRAIEKQLQERKDEMRVYFRNGLVFISPDKKFKYMIGGRLHVDYDFYDSDEIFRANFSEPGSGAEFRRARFFISGLLYNRVKFKAEYDFVGQTAFKDVYLGLIKLPVVGNFNVGHFFEPFSLEVFTSSKYDTFMEDSLMNAFVPGRNIGAVIYDSALKDRATWAIGVFRPTAEDPPRIQSHDGYSITSRVTAVPVKLEKGRKLVHVGFGYSFSESNESTLQFDSKPESNLTAVNFVDTGAFSAKQAHRFGWEAAAVLNSFSIQGEYTLVKVSRPSGLQEVNFNGGYVMVSYFLTGEHRKYKRGAFTRVSPRKNFLEGRGLGAWEMALRFSTIDLNDGGIAGGKEKDVTAGLNWYLNPHTRVMFNYVHADITGAPTVDFGDLHIYEFRFQVNF
jgi:phosphate-selective porin OprO and OprP